MASARFHWTMALSCSIFMVVFLVVFLPFGVNEPKKDFSLVFIFQMSLFGIVMLLTLALNEILLRKRTIGKWTIKNFTFWIIWVFILTGTVNFMLYNYLQSWYDFYLTSYLIHVLNVASVLVFPVAGTFYYFNHQKMKENLVRLKEAKEIISSLDVQITFEGGSPRELISLPIKQILFLEADDNYVNLYYWDKDKVVKHVLRNTLSNIENQDYPVEFLVRSHRSFIVNKHMVRQLKGNVQKSTLKLQHIDQIIPVSRSYIHSTRVALKNR